MGIKSNFTPADIRKVFAEKMKAMDANIVNRLIDVGERFVNNARSKGNYTDWTGNLRSSVCYIVQKDGKKRSPGAIPDESKKLISELRSKYLSGYVLIVCTGMNYAAAVESKGKDVLTGSSIIAKAELKRALKTLKK